MMPRKHGKAVGRALPDGNKSLDGELFGLFRVEQRSSGNRPPRASKSKKGRNYDAVVVSFFISLLKKGRN